MKRSPYQPTFEREMRLFSLEKKETNIRINSTFLTNGLHFSLARGLRKPLVFPVIHYPTDVFLIRNEPAREDNNIVVIRMIS